MSSARPPYSHFFSRSRRYLDIESPDTEPYISYYHTKEFTFIGDGGTELMGYSAIFKGDNCDLADIDEANIIPTIFYGGNGGNMWMNVYDTRLFLTDDAWPAANDCR
jgi:hypothetical protein